MEMIEDYRAWIPSFCSRSKGTLNTSQYEHNLEVCWLLRGSLCHMFISSNAPQLGSRRVSRPRDRRYFRDSLHESRQIRISNVSNLAGIPTPRPSQSLRYGRRRGRGECSPQALWYFCNVVSSLTLQTPSN
jgi:hypothetical protein